MPDGVDFDSIYFTIATPEILPESVSIPTTAGVRVRDTYTIYPTVAPSTSIPKWTWVSSDRNVAEVIAAENGKSCVITGVAPGTATITGTTQNGLTASCAVTVTDAPLPESGTVDPEYRVGVGGYVDIIPVLTPADATTLYEVTSDNPHVAGVGTTAGHTGVRIEGNNAGTAVITIRGANNLLMTTTVRVGRESDRQHEKTTRAGWAATCTRPGRTDSVVCSACWYVFTEAQEIPMTGHSYGPWTVRREPTASSSGLRERVCENCGRRETETLPATGGAVVPVDPAPVVPVVPNPGSSGSSGGTAAVPAPAAPSHETIPAGSQKLPVTVESGTVHVSASADDVSAVLAEAAVSGTVHLDLTAVEDAAALSLPRNLVGAIADSEAVTGLAVSAAGGSVQMSGEALRTVSGALTGAEDQVSFRIETVDAADIPAAQKYPIANVLNSAVFVELSAVVTHRDETLQTLSVERIHEFRGDVTVSVPFTPSADLAGRQIIACYIADDGAITYFPVRYENGVATFTTTHFSAFAVLESRAAAFRDVDIGAWYMTGVEAVLNSGLMTGTSPDAFSPQSPMTRAMVWTVLGRLAGADVSGAGNDWYARARIWAMAEDVSDGTNPAGNISRQELAVMLWRAQGSPEAAFDLARFGDSAQAAEWAVPALRWAAANSILTGDNGRLNPAGSATRAEVAAMLQRYCQLTNP